VRQAQEKGIPILTEIEFLTLLGDVRSAAILKNNDFEIKNNVLIKYTGRGGDVEIPAGVTKIGRDAFAECKNLISVKLPASVAEIGIYAFSGCSSLRSIEIPEGVTEICGYTFMGCKNLQEVKLPESLVEIGHKAFCGCSALSRIWIPKNVYWIGSWAFASCYSLEEIVLPELVTRVCGQTFAGCSGLKRVTMSGNVTQIDEIAFKFCNHLVSLTGTENVTEIGIEAFSGCVRLISLPLPKIPLSVLEKKKAATKRQACLGFLQTAKHCTDPVVFAEYKKYAIHQRTEFMPWILHNDVLNALAFYAENGRVTAANFEKEYLIPAQEAKAVNCIAYLMKWSSENIKPEDWAKEEKKEIRKALRPERKKSPYNVADMQKLWYYRAEKDGTITIRRYIGSETAVMVPEKIGRKPVVRIGQYAFSDLKDLISVEIPEGVTEIEHSAFSKAYALETIVLPNSIRRIGWCAFWDCLSLTEIVIPDGVTKIEEATFARCKNLKMAVIPASVTQIHRIAFYTGYNLTIKGKANSYAEQYAKENNIPFVAE
jgi:hypothetical protein